MLNKFHVLKCAFFGAVILCLAYLIHGGFYYEEGTDVFLKNFISGSFSEQPSNFFHTFGMHTFSSDLIAFLYSLSPGVNWYDLWILFLLFYTAFLLIHVLFKLLNDEEHWLINILIAVVLLIAFTEHLMLIQLTRIAIILSFLGLWVYLRRNESTLFRIFGLAGFILGIIGRAESGYLALMIVSVLFIIEHLGINFIFTLKRLILPMGIAILMGLALNTPINEEDARYLEFRPYQFTLWDFQRPPENLELRTAQDSIKFKLASYAFMNDPDEINKAFFDRINLIPLDKKPADLGNYFKDLSSNIPKLSKALARFRPIYWPVFTAIFLLILFNGVILARSSSAELLKWVLGTSFFIVLILLMVLLMKMENRLLGPLSFAFLFQQIYNLKNSDPVLRMPNILQVLSTLSVGIMIFQCVQLRPLLQERKDNAQYIDFMLSEIEELYPQHEVFINLDVLDKLGIRIGSDPVKSCDLPLYTFDNTVMCYADGYRATMIKKFGAFDIESMLDYIESNKGKCIIVSSEPRLNLLLNYYKIVHNQPFFYEEEFYNVRLRYTDKHSHISKLFYLGYYRFN